MEIVFEGRHFAFDPPGPGSWSIDGVHAPRPFSKFQAEIHSENLPIGFREGTRRYGLLVDTLLFNFVNGFAYTSVAPAPGEEVPARFAAADEVFEKRIWREDMRRWDGEVKPATIRTQLSLQAVDPSKLDDAELLAHIAACRANLQEMVRQHHRFSVPAMLPVGDLIAHLSVWTDRPHGEFLALLRGSAPESAGQYAELDALVEAIRGDSTAKALLMGRSDPGEILDRLRATPGAVGVALTGYLDLVGYRILDGLDTGAPYGLEVPDVLVNALRHAVERGAPAAARAKGPEEGSVRDMIPAAHRETFDALLAEARTTSRLRDERGLYCDVWAAGLCRRAITEAGARLVARGRLEHPTHLVEAGYEEIRQILAGDGGPSAEELGARRRFRDTYKASDMPPLLGDAPQPPPPLEGLPPNSQRAMRAFMAAVHSLFAPAASDGVSASVRGIGASPGVYTGTARVLGSPAEFGRLEQGDVLVTATTTESFNIVLPILGAIVTDTGGLLSHAAIVCREYGMPGVVGCRDATRRIPDGATVRVDGGKGEVHVVS